MFNHMTNIDFLNNIHERIRYGIYKYFWLFVIGSVIGCCLETIWCLICLGHIESRKGLIYGPFIPVYGFGAIVLSLVLNRLRSFHWYIIFFVGFLTGGAFEYICSFVQEYVFGSISWEYSDSPLNINGRTNLFYSACWGVLSILLVKKILPAIEKFISSIPYKLGKYLAIILALFLVFDVTISSLAVRRNTERLQNIPPKNSLSVFLDEYYTSEYLASVFPNMKFVREN